MNFIPSRAAAFSFHVLLEQTDAGQIIASISELANCQVEADTREEALAAIQKLFRDRLSNVEVLPLEVSLEQSVRENLWTEFIGMFEGDAEFAEMATQWQAERAQDTDDVA
jgi:predicted RNase H-like HicB family nuclease